MQPCVERKTRRQLTKLSSVVGFDEKALNNMSKVTPFLWFDTNAEEAAKFYTATFKNCRITSKSTYPEGSPYPPGTAMTVNFELEGVEFTLLNGGPAFKLSEAFSISVLCDDQAEVDHLWNALTSNGGEESMCGWLKDKYGLSWQIVPTILGKMIADPDPQKPK